MRSGTSGFSITAVRGSGRGTSGTCTRPAPSRLRPEALVDLADERTDTEWVPARPDSDNDRESRPDTERREVDERDEEREDARDEDCELLRADELLDPRPPPATPVGGELTMPSPSSRLRSNRGDPMGETTGARPQVSQYSSPPPMSS
ncbi:hypothetical protein [Streptomyces sp. SAS_281]|uniref:hypothetical protein n=1 Tax=Streptomyces sp. SAS_281 TaxID=3412744 RepID=UPI00403D0C0B